MGHPHLPSIERHRSWYRALTVTVLAVLVGASSPTVAAQCAAKTRDAEVVQPAAAALPSPSASPSPSPSPTGPTAACPFPTTGFDCAQQRRFAAVQAYLVGRPGVTAVVFRDRSTAAIWRNAHTGRSIWTASTIKLALAVDLLLLDRSGAITLTAGDHYRLDAALRTSSDSAATALWEKYDGASATARYRSYGLTNLTYPVGVYWGSAKSTADDLDLLMNFVLDKLPAALRSYIVEALVKVGASQRWGVWGAGAAANPGNKNGWWGYSTGWVINSVGFLGPGQRYTVTLMNDLQGKGNYSTGVQTTTRVAALLSPTTPAPAPPAG